MAQFEDESMEIIVRTRYGWKKGDRPFPKFGKESLADIHYHVPWLNDPKGPLGDYGRIFWFCKKSLFGYPYKPHFSENVVLYRLRVRPGRFSPSDMPILLMFIMVVMRMIVRILSISGVIK